MTVHEELWKQQRNFLQGSINRLTEENKHKRLNPNTASSGFLALHVVEAIHTIAAMVLDQPLQVELSINMGDKDDGRDISIARIHELLASADVVMQRVFDTFTEEKWQQKVPSPFGEITHTQGLGFLIYHTAYHVGQIALTGKKGS